MDQLTEVDKLRALPMLRALVLSGEYLYCSLSLVFA